MFEETIILSQPIKKVEWAEEVFPELDASRDSSSEKNQADSMLTNEDILNQAQQIASDQRQTMQLEEIRDLFETISQSVEKHFGMLSRRMRAIENNVIALALAVAKKVIDKELDINPNVVRTSVAKALQRVDEENNVIIQINPEDKEVIEKYWDELISEDHRNGWKLETKSSIGRGGCIIRSANEIIDATIESQMQLVERVLADNMNSSTTNSEGAVEV